MWKTKFGVLLAALSLVAVACGDDTTTDTTVPADTSTTTNTVAPTTSAPPPTTPAPSTTTEAPAAFPVTISANNGEIEIPAFPVSIVSLSATHTEMLYAIGAGAQVVAVDMFSNYPEGTPLTELTGFTPSVEAIVGFDADLVVIDGDWDGSSVAALTELGVPVVVLPAANTLDDVYSQIERLGVATAHIGEATELVGQMKTDIDEILTGIPAVDEPLTFYHELDTVFFSVTTETFIGQLYELMGLVNIADSVGEGSFGYPQLSEEYIIEQDPDLIFLADTICCAMNADSIADRPGWATLTAVQNGGVIELSDDVASRWGPRIVDYMRAVAEALAAVPVES